MHASNFTAIARRLYLPARTTIPFALVFFATLSNTNCLLTDWRTGPGCNCVKAMPSNSRARHTQGLSLHVSMCACRERACARARVLVCVIADEGSRDASLSTL